jgi:hypothetical protein
VTIDIFKSYRQDSTKYLGGIKVKMSAAVGDPLGDPDQVLLSWSDSPDSPKKQELGQIITVHASDAVIRSVAAITVNTTIRVTGKHYTGNGIVRSCVKSDTGYILTLTKSDDLPFQGSKRDPGVVAVENFLTEEQEAQILKGLKNETLRSATLPEFRLSWGHLDTSALVS